MAPHDRTRWEFPILGTLLLMAFIVGVLAVASVRIAQSQDDSQVRELKSRAAACRVLIEMGVDLDPDGPCLEAEVLPFYPETGP